MSSIVEHVARRYAARQYWGSRGGGILPLARSSGRLLLNYRSASVNEPHTWGVWGGKLEGDESFRDGALREFTEETTYRGSINLHRIHTFDDGDFEYRTFLGVIPEEFAPRLDWESQDYMWAPPEDLKNMSDLHFGLRNIVTSSMSKILSFL